MFHPLSKAWSIGLAAFTAPTQRYRQLWLGLSLAIAAFYGFLAMHQAFASEYVVQDDARQHIFWLQRFVDPELFPEDLIADYFQGVAPPGFTGLYQLLAWLGLHPFTVSKILPFFLGLITTGYFYGLSLALFDLPFAGFVSTVSFNQSLWYSSELASATPRAFLYPLFLAFIYYLVRENRGLCLLSLILQALFYPQIALISLGVLALQLVKWQHRKLYWSKKPLDYLQLGIGFGGVAAILLIAQGQADFGEVITRAAAIALPEFQPDGRNAFFDEGFNYWLSGRSGIFHERGFTPATLIAGAFLPILLGLPVKSRLRERISPQIRVLGQILIVSFGLFFLAHLLLFQLHLPSRYTSHTLRVVLALACGISWIILLDDLSRWLAAWRFRHRRSTLNPSQIERVHQRSVIFSLLSGALALWVVTYPTVFLANFPKVGNYDFFQQRKLYQYFAAQPKDSIIASLSVETSNIPMFSARTVLTSPEHAIAYHQGYYGEFRRRTEALIEAQYSTEAEALRKATKTYGIDFWLLDDNAFQVPYIRNNHWLMQYQPMANNAAERLTQGQQPLLQRAIPLCTVARGKGWRILDAGCVDQFAAKAGDRPPKSGQTSGNSP